MNPFPTLSPRTVAVYLSVLVLGAGGCELGSGASTAQPTSPQPTDPALAWVGTFRGGGAGTAGSAAVEWDEVALRIRPDADSATAEGCDPCLVLSLDTLFEAMHVRAPSDVEHTLVVEGEDVRRTHQLLRYRGAGGTANVVDASLRVEQGSATTLEARFLLNR